jgi:hypothetical protein
MRRLSWFSDWFMALGVVYGSQAVKPPPFALLEEHPAGRRLIPTGPRQTRSTDPGQIDPLPPARVHRPPRGRQFA